jgi:hypothetical protein
LTYIDLVDPILIENDDFDPKQLETHFYIDQHGLTQIDPVGFVLTENDSFDLKLPETYFLSRSTRFDPY